MKLEQLYESEDYDFSAWSEVDSDEDFFADLHDDPDVQKMIQSSMVRNKPLFPPIDKLVDKWVEIVLNNEEYLPELVAAASILQIKSWKEILCISNFPPHPEDPHLPKNKTPDDIPRAFDVARSSMKIRRNLDIPVSNFFAATGTIGGKEAVVVADDQVFYVVKK
jgi:hypothetical protein